MLNKTRNWLIAKLVGKKPVMMNLKLRTTNIDILNDFNKESGIMMDNSFYQ